MQAQFTLQARVQTNTVSDRPFEQALPVKLTQAYHGKSQTQINALKIMEKCPFPSLRQLSLMYVNPKETVVDTGKCDILLEKFIEEPSSLQSDQQTLKGVESVRDELRRLTKLSAVTREYVDRLRDVGEPKGEHISDELDTKINALEREKSYKIASVKGQEAIAKIQEENFAELRRLMLQQFDKFKNQATFLSQQLNAASVYKIYEFEFEKCLICIAKEKQVPEIASKTLNTDWILSFIESMKQQMAILQKFIDNQSRLHFEWCNRLKHKLQKKQDQKIGPETTTRVQTLFAVIFSEIYCKIPWLVDTLRADQVQIGAKSNRFREQQKKFMVKYLDVKELSTVVSHIKKIDQIVAAEKQAIANHLRKNYGMIVPYAKSDEYNEFSVHLSQSKPYLRNLLYQKVSSIEETLTYINSDYTKLHRDACDNKVGTRRAIQNKIEAFGKQSEIFLELLSESLRKLLIIAQK